MFNYSQIHNRLRSPLVSIVRPALSLSWQFATKDGWQNILAARQDDTATYSAPSLQAGLPDMPLLCDLENTSLDLSPDYEALSYVGGAADDLKTDISIRKERKLFQFPVLPNLRSALLHLRKVNEDRTIWIDALCINQADNAERSLKVPMMGDIYRSAQRVIIWLGKEAERGGLALQFIRRITDLSQFDLAIKDELCTREWYALSRLMNRSWFTRRWAVQELALARDAKIYCGAGEVEWASFADAATLFGQKIQDVAQLFKRSAEFLRVKDSNTIVNRQKDSNTITTPRTSHTILMTSLSLHPIVAPFNLKPHCRPRRRSTSLSPPTPNYVASYTL
jgi:hypothetical protein